ISTRSASSRTSGSTMSVPGSTGPWREWSRLTATGWRAVDALHRLRQSRKKRAAPEGAAEFREETPRKGGGMQSRARNAVLQQYARHPTSLQASLNGSQKEIMAEKLIFLAK